MGARHLACHMVEVPDLLRWEYGRELEHLIFTAAIGLLVLIQGATSVIAVPDPVVRLTHSLILFGAVLGVWDCSRAARKTMLAWALLIAAISLLFGAIAGGSTTGAVGLLGKTIWTGSAFAALVLGLSLLPAWVLSKSGRGSPTLAGESPEERLLTEEERREGGFSDDELRQMLRKLVHKPATIR